MPGSVPFGPHSARNSAATLTKARTLLMQALTRTDDADEIQRMFDTY